MCVMLHGNSFLCVLIWRRMLWCVGVWAALFFKIPNLCNFCILYIPGTFHPRMSIRQIHASLTAQPVFSEPCQYLQERPLGHVNSPLIIVWYAPSRECTSYVCVTHLVFIPIPLHAHFVTKTLQTDGMTFVRDSILI